MQKRTFLTDATPVSIDSPVQIIGLIVINATDKDCVVTTDNGDTFPAPALVISTWSLPPTLRVQAQLTAKPTNAQACNVIVTDDVTLNSTSQLATLAGAGAKAITSYGTTLPPTPADGDLAILVDSVSNPTWQWLFRYNANSTSGFKWECIGDSPATSLDVGNNLLAAANVYASTNAIVAVPRSGEYLVASEMHLNQDVAQNADITQGINYDGADHDGNHFLIRNAGDEIAFPSSFGIITVAAPGNIILRWKSTARSAASYPRTTRAFLHVRPLRT